MINTSNFFKRNTSIRNPTSPYKKGKFVDQSSEYKSRVFSRVKENPLTKTLLSMRKNIFSIENTLKSLFQLDKKKQTSDKKFDSAENQEARDRPKVKPKIPKIFGNLIERPKTGILDIVKNFVTFTFLGWLFTTLQPFIDKAGGLIPLLNGVMKFFSGIIVGTLDALASFLKFGYDVKDTFDVKIAEIKKEAEGINKHFDNTLGELKAIFSGAIEVVNSFLNISADEEELNNARQDVAQDSPEANIPPLPTLPDAGNYTQVSPSSSTASNINGGPPIAKPSPMSLTSPTIQAVNTGGQIGQSERIDPRKAPITRGVEKKERRAVTRRPNIQQQKTVPGRDVGGEDKLKEIYGEESNPLNSDFVPNSSFFRTENKSGYSGLLKASEEYKRPNDRDVLGLGNLMGATIDTTLGQKFERRTITQFAEGIRHMVEQGMSDPEEFKKIDLELMLRRIIEPKIESAINKIRNEVDKKSKSSFMDPSSPGGGGMDGDLAGGAISPSELYKELGVTSEQWDIFRNSIALIESGGSYSIFGGSGDHYDGRYQMGADAKKDGAKVSGISFPGHSSNPNSKVRSAFRNDPQLQEVLFTGFTIANHRYLMKNPKYASASSERKLQILGYAHNQGMGGANNWLNTGQVGLDGFGTKGTKYTDLIAENFKRKGRGESLRVATGAVSHKMAITSDKIFPLEAGQGRDASGESGLDFTYRGGYTLALYPGKVVGIGSQFNSRSGRGYGNYVLVESVDPNNGKKFTTLYAHFGDGKIEVRKGSNISAGQIIGHQPNKRKSGYFTGSGSGEHTSADFFELDGRTRYRNSNQLVNQVLGSFTGRTKGYPMHSTGSETQIQTKPITGNANPPLSPHKFDNGYLIGNDMYYMDSKTKKIYVIRNNKRVDIDLSSGKNIWVIEHIKKLQGASKQSSRLNIKSNNNTIMPLNRYASYNDPSSQTVIAIYQPIEKLVPVSTGSGSGSIITFAAPTVNNNTDQQLSRA